MVAVRFSCLAAACCAAVVVFFSFGAAPRQPGHPTVTSSAFPAAVAGTPRVRAKAAARTGMPADPWWAREWGLARIGLPALWRTTVGSPGVVVAVVDTGVDAGGPDLAGASLRGHNTVDGSDDVHDEVGHGTMVAEVALGRGDNRRQGTGVCWRCKLLPVKVAPTGSAAGDQLAAGIMWAADHGADVINVSLVLNGRDDAVEHAVAHALAVGSLVVASAGNDGGTTASYPASYPGVISVVGVDEHDRPYAWSTRGAWASVSAPGCSVVAAAGGAETNFCGSSAAAPVVSGLAALLLSVGIPRDRVTTMLLASGVRSDGAVASGGRVNAARIAAALPRE
jgi:subtilisin family serine protease